MAIIPPTKSDLVEDKRNNRKLTFEYPSKDVSVNLPKTGEYILAPSICWPRFTGSGYDGYYGCCMLGIKNVEDEKIYIIEERMFETIDNIIDDESGVMTKRGFSSFCGYLKDKYLFNRYYCSNEKEVFRRYARQVKQSKFITDPKPRMMHSQYKKFEKCLSDIYEFLTLGKLFYNRDSDLFKMITTLRYEEKKFLPQSMEALSYILMAFEKG